MTDTEKAALEKRINELEAENAKLRKRIQEVLDDAWSKDYYMPSEWLEKELRELGIEVDG